MGAMTANVEITGEKCSCGERNTAAKEIAYSKQCSCLVEVQEPIRRRRVRQHMGAMGVAARASQSLTSGVLSMGAFEAECALGLDWMWDEVGQASRAFDGEHVVGEDWVWHFA